MTILTGGRANIQYTNIVSNLSFKWKAEIVSVVKSVCGFRPPKEQRSWIIGTTWRTIKQDLTSDVNIAGRGRIITSDQYADLSYLKKVVFVRLLMYRPVRKNQFVCKRKICLLECPTQGHYFESLIIECRESAEENVHKQQRSWKVKVKVKVNVKVQSSPFMLCRCTGKVEV
jgi:hypothetical protein